ncbi:MAG: hypothetical protein JJU19_03850 [Pararhodobacter sp.]|nr:hypothetical protein [Pararhodobacter sp.]
MAAALAVSLASGAGTGAAQAQAPLSAIDWLQEAQDLPALPDGPATDTGLSGVALPDTGFPVTPNTGDLWVSDIISMQSIDTPRPESVGLFPAARVGLPTDLWAGTPATELSVLIRALPNDTLPALRGLALSLLLAEMDPPAPDPGSTGPESGADARQASALAFVLARIDKLIAFGALDQAAALLDTLASPDPLLRERAFDIALLLGDEGAACRDVLQGDPPFTGAAQRVFCLARDSRWTEADRLHGELTEAGGLRAPYSVLLERFLDADDLLHDETPPSWLTEDFVQPQNLSPLGWRLLEAIGAPVASHGLPVAFAHADLRGTIGWRAQLEAAERLVRSGALPPNRLLGLYTERNAAASGGIWERVRAVQRLERALAGSDAAAMAAALAHAWPLIVAGELEVPFARLYTQALLAAPLGDAAARQAAEIGLLDTEPVHAARRLTDGSARQRFLAGIALGEQAAPPQGSGSVLYATVADAMARDLPELPAPLAQQLADGRAGAALLILLARLDGVIDPDALGNALVLMRHLGLDALARTTALQALLLERRG